MEPLDHDAAYKGIYGHAFMVEELARWLLPSREGGRELVDALNFGTLERAQEQSVDQGRRRRNDMVWQAQFRDRDEDDPKSWMHLVLMLEFQSTVDHLMALRCRQYVDNLHMENLRGQYFGSTDRLPPVLVFVIYNGASEWDAELRVIDLVTPGPTPASPPDLSPSSPLFGGDGYIAVDSGRLGADDLRTDNAAALLAGIEHPSPDTAPSLALRLYRRLEDPNLRALRESVHAWARQVVGRRLNLDLGGVERMAEVDRLEDPELEAYWEARRQEMFGEYIARGREQGLEQGLEQGRAEARAEERARLRRQAAKRFGDDVAAPLAAWLEDVDDAERLAQAGDWIVDCATGAELVERLEAALPP